MVQTLCGTPWRHAVVAIVGLCCLERAALAGPAVPPAPLPAPTGPVVVVSTVGQLQQAVAALTSNTTIVVAAGTYQLTAPLYINGTFTNVGIRGATGNRDDVVIVGRGMTGSNDGGMPFGIWVGGDVRGVTIAHLTIRDVFNHPIILNAGTESPFVHNVRLASAGQQFVKADPRPRSLTAIHSSTANGRLRSASFSGPRTITSATSSATISCTAARRPSGATDIGADEHRPSAPPSAPVNLPCRSLS